MTLTVCTLTHIRAGVCFFFSGPENNYGYAFNTGYGQQPIATNDVSTVLIKNFKSFKHFVTFSVIKHSNVRGALYIKNLREEEPSKNSINN